MALSWTQIGEPGDWVHVRRFERALWVFRRASQWAPELRDVVLTWRRDCQHPGPCAPHCGTWVKVIRGERTARELLLAPGRGINKTIGYLVAFARGNES